MSIHTRITADPQLPRANPTQATWQRPPHALARVASLSLPEVTDIAIIGSGITGMSAARTMLEKNSDLRVSVLEARELCSGATGRNGGQLVVNSAETYGATRAMLGPQMAGKIVRFHLRTLERTRELIKQHGLEDEAQLVDVSKVRACLDVQSWENMKNGIALLESDHPSLRGTYRVIDGEACREQYGINGAVAGAVLSAGTVWPYRLVCSIFESLLRTHNGRFNIETNTPVMMVSHEPGTSVTHPYMLQTPRGTTRAKKVVYCVNGHTGHLFPKLRGPTFPLTGTMTVQDLGPTTPKRGSSTSWGVHQSPRVEGNGLYDDGLQYIAQNARSNLFYMGGDKVRPGEAICANDDRTYPSSITFLQNRICRLLGSTASESKLVDAWSGVMGFSADGMPLVGRLPSRLTDRDGDEEWISAVYNGYGMSCALLAGEAVADMALGIAVEPSFPEAYLLTDARLESSLTTEATLRMLETNTIQTKL